MTQIQKIGIIGAGQMGRGIAQVAAQAGYQTVMFDVSPQGLGVRFYQWPMD
jgi:3-hydroxybutyryl-CoA dehydrogenase